jgi:hypothetical protein
MEHEPIIYLAEQQIRRRPKRPAPVRQTTPRKRTPQKAATTTVKNLGLEMERLILHESQNRVMPRCSTPTNEMCFHCCHDHKEDCCLYLNDEPIDGPRYSKWKYDLEYPGVAMLPPQTPMLPEAVSGNTTPQCLYGHPIGGEPPIPTVFLRQFYYPWFQHNFQPVELVPPPNFAAPPMMEPIPQYIPQQLPTVQQHQPIQLQPFNQAFHSQPIAIGTAAGSYYMTPMLYSVTPSSYYYSPPMGPSFVSLFSHS